MPAAPLRAMPCSDQRGPRAGAANLIARTWCAVFPIFLCGLEKMHPSTRSSRPAGTTPSRVPRLWFQPRYRLMLREDVRPPDSPAAGDQTHRRRRRQSISCMACEAGWWHRLRRAAILQCLLVHCLLITSSRAPVVASPRARSEKSPSRSDARTFEIVCKGSATFLRMAVENASQKPATSSIRVMMSRGE